MADLPTDEGVNTAIEYWIEAEGPSGATARAGSPGTPFPIEVSTTPARDETPPVVAPDPDVVAPTIRHAAVATGTTGEPQRFEATVTDEDSGVVDVTLFHRDAPDEEFAELPMLPTDGDDYAATLPPSDEPGTIEYFIEAEDAAGTAVTRGSRFSPLERRVEAPAVPITVVPGGAADVATSGPVGTDAAGEPPEPRSRALWYVLGGALVVGLIAGLAGGGGGEDDDDEPVFPPTTTGGDCCDVTFVVDTPR